MANVLPSRIFYTPVDGRLVLALKTTYTVICGRASNRCEAEFNPLRPLMAVYARGRQSTYCVYESYRRQVTEVVSAEKHRLSLICPRHCESFFLLPTFTTE